MTAQATENLTGDYTIDPAHSRLGFVARHAMITKVRGQFGEYEGRAHVDFDNPEGSSAQVTIETQSVNTHNEDRDQHLRTNDFFDAPNHPKITFSSTKVQKVGDAFRVDGDLTIKGVTKPVSVDFDYEGSAKDPFGNTRLGFEGRLTVDRKDWGLEWNAPLDTGGVLVGDKVTLEFEISALRGAPAAG